MTGNPPPMRLDRLTPERWKRVRQIADSILDSPQDSLAILHRECPSDDELREAVLSVVQQFSDSEDLLGAHSIRITTTDSPTLAVGDLVGAYRIESELGSGGMGTVYLAARADDAFSKTVAIKTLTSVASHQSLELFLKERRILAALDHPNITRILDAGATASGAPYIVMDHIQGTSFADYTANLPTSRILRLFLGVCSAVHYAHTHMVLHCDLKPGNILVTPDGEIRVLDFGLAQYAGEGSRAPGLTAAYSSPEQSAGLPLSTQSDIYSLGKVLANSLAQRPLRPDLAAILARSTAPQPSQRYSTVLDLSQDIERYLALLPVAARPASLWHRASLFARRSPWRVMGSAMLAATIVLGVWGTFSQQRLALRRFDDIRGLARSVVFAYQEELAKIQGSTALRARIATDTLSYLDKLAADAGSDESLRREIALAYRKVAEAQGYQHTPNIGKVTAALSSITNSVNLLDALFALHPEDSTLRAELAVSLERQANILSLSGRNHESRSAALRAITLAPESARSAPYRELSSALLSLGLTTEAVTAARQAVAASSDRQSRALANWQLSRAVLTGVNTTQEALNAALAAAREYQNCPPSDAACAVGHLNAQYHLARYYKLADQPETALTTAAHGETEAHSALIADPNDWAVWRILRNLQSIEGDSLRQLRRLPEMRVKYASTVATSERMVQNEPGHPEGICLVIAAKARYGEVLIEEFHNVPEAQRVLEDAVRQADEQKSDSSMCLDSRKMAVINLARVAEGKGDWEGGMHWRRETVKNAVDFALRSPGEPLSLVIEAGANYELGLGGLEASRHGLPRERLTEARNALLRSREIYLQLARMGNPIYYQYPGWPEKTERLIAEIEKRLAAL